MYLMLLKIYQNIPLQKINKSSMFEINYEKLNANAFVISLKASC